MTEVYADALARLAGHLNPGCLVVMERQKDVSLTLPEGFRTFDTRLYGDTAVEFARYM
jgi:16S rRNA G966 N2-methylase RsmD